MEELPVIAKTYEVYKKIQELNDGLDKKYRNSIGEPLIRQCEAVLRQLLIAKYAPKAVREQFLIRGNAEAELLTLQLRSVLERKLANETNVLKIQANLAEARRMLGGWLKSVRS
jgi:hypothetical protein